MIRRRLSILSILAISASLMAVVGMEVMPAAAHALDAMPEQRAVDETTSAADRLRAESPPRSRRLLAIPMHTVESSSGGLEPAGITPGNCGYAYMELYKQGPTIYQEWGFFDLSVLATSYSWSGMMEVTATNGVTTCIGSATDSIFK